MLLTRIWSVILAVLAVGCLAGMFLLSAAGSSGEFTEADKAAIRAVTEAGVAALEAEIQSSPVQQLGVVGFDPRLQQALARTEAVPVEELPEDELPLEQIVVEVAEALRVRADSDKLTLAVVEKTGAITFANGFAEPSMGELVASDAFKAVPPTEEALFSITLGSEIYVAKVAAAAESGRRLVAVDTLQIGAGSLLRRVLGSDTPAALVRKGALVGMIGDLEVTTEIETLAREHQEDVSEEGASKVFTVGEGLDMRIGCLGRVPGPAGSGRSGAMLAVLSRSTAAAGKRDLGEALGDARDKGLLGRVNWALLVGLFAVSAGLAIYLPQLEATGPMRRLGRELGAVSQGTQHQIFHDRYSGVPGELARSAAGAVDALRQAFLAELEIEEEAPDDPEGQRRARTNRQRRLTRAHQKLGEKKGSGAQPSQTSRRRRAGSRPEPDVADPSPSAPSAEWADTPEPANATLPTPVTSHEELGAEPFQEPAIHPDHGLPIISPVAMPPKPPPASTQRPAPTFGKPPAPSPVAPPLQPPPRVATPIAPSTGLGTGGLGTGLGAMRHATPLVSTPMNRPPPSGSAVPVPVRTGATVPPPSSSSSPSLSPSMDPKEAAYHEIYDEFVQVKAACGEPTESLTFDRFAAKLRKNERDLRKNRPDIRDVEFTVYVKDGKAALKAKVVK